MRGTPLPRSLGTGVGTQHVGAVNAAMWVGKVARARLTGVARHRPRYPPLALDLEGSCRDRGEDVGLALEGRDRAVNAVLLQDRGEPSIGVGEIRAPAELTSEYTDKSIGKPILDPAGDPVGSCVDTHSVRWSSELERQIGSRARTRSG
jgi:hypothetical protein